MARCDLCGKACEVQELETLPPHEQAAGVSDICPRCSRWMAMVRRKLVRQIPGHIRDAIANRVGQRPDPWWRRIFRRLAKRAA